ncbi:MAG: NADH-quinone oxidoreductase subunit J [Puniceicoccales bacterium]|jgi:NADH:ubiquinone oxidoreductase subunit 6 (subunit J)|nr:NADH-quinone oxidoreductase subunit J [Puniceicoccales bacterium]
MISLENLPLLLAMAFSLVAACAAFAQRNIIHGVLLLPAAWGGLAAFYLWIGAEFIAFAQVLVNVGAISMVALFAVLLTRRGGDPEEPPAARKATVSRAIFGIATVFLATVIIGAAMLAHPFPEFSNPVKNAAAAPPSATKALGTALVTEHSLALLITGTLLSAALLGAIRLAAADKRES